MEKSTYESDKTTLKNKLNWGVISRKQYNQELKELEFAHAKIITKVLALLNIIKI